MAGEGRITRLAEGQLVQWNRDWLKKRHLLVSSAVCTEEPGIVIRPTPLGALVCWANGHQCSLLREQLEPYEDGNGANRLFPWERRAAQ